MMTFHKMLENVFDLEIACPRITTQLERFGIYEFTFHNKKLK